MKAWQRSDGPFHDDDGAEQYASPLAPSESSPGSGASCSFSATVALRFGGRLKTLSTLLYVAGALAMLLFIHGGWFEFTGEEVRALDRTVFAGGILVGSVWFFPWHRFGRNVLLVPAFTGLALITLAVYFSGGWQSPLSVFYLFVVVFFASYFSTEVAALCVAVTLLAGLSPQLYAPDQTRLVEYLIVHIPAYAGVVLACGYALWERTGLQSERDSQRIKDLEERLWHEASLDPLTGLHNRGRFETRFKEE